ncbi:chloramphenicol-sensitive protein RarD [Citreimonas salinaria]|uniref:Chloramphenicol-sensitive protein RarD n=1 Tax=Citreimonas salinaria TaxID=321339 RepID=A0A1H3H3T5_9RHOB|nr:chloramphenicol-sensitive protein RarD [Citreimonas salinaria]
MDSARSGVIAMVAACVIWGLSPLYYKLLSHVPPLEVLAHRTLWSLVTFAIFLGMQGRLRMLGAALGTARAAGLTTAAAVAISCNWFLFIMSVQTGRTTEASLGYYIFPLVAVLLGVLAFGERLAKLQWAAVALAAAAVVVMTLGEGVTPLISLMIAFTFGIYGLVKKGLSVGPVVSVTAEVTVLAPLAMGWLVWTHLEGGGAYAADPATTALLMVSGPLTAVPLVLFSRAAVRVRYATVGLIQYLNPTLQFFCAVIIFAEPFTTVHAAVFGLIWAALALYSASAFASDRARRRRPITSVAEPPERTKSSSDASAKPARTT